MTDAKTMSDEELGTAILDAILPRGDDGKQSGACAVAARARSLLSASPAPVACEPVTIEELSNVIGWAMVNATKDKPAPILAAERVMAFLAKARSLLSASPAPVACEPLSNSEMVDAYHEWLSSPALFTTEVGRMQLLAIGAKWQRAKVRPVVLPTRTELAKVLLQAAKVAGAGPGDAYWETFADALLALLAKCEPAKSEQGCPDCNYSRAPGECCGNVNPNCCGDGPSAPPQEPPASPAPALDALLKEWHSVIADSLAHDIRNAFATDTRALRERAEKAECELAGMDELRKELAKRGKSVPSPCLEAVAVIRAYHDELTQMDAKVTDLRAQLEAARAAIEHGVVRPEVTAFAAIMEQKLKENDHKDNWSNSALDWLLGRAAEELREVADAIPASELDKAPPFVGDPEASRTIARECADVANFAMMIADNCGGLRIPQPETKEGK